MAQEIENGRPSEYRVEFVEKAEEYLQHCQDSIERELESVNSHTGRERFERVVKVNLPTVEGFARFIGVTKQTLHNWAKENQDFFDALEKVKVEQHDRLINNGLAGTYNPTIAKLMLSSNHGYKEKQDVTSDDEKLESGVVVLPSKDGAES